MAWIPIENNGMETPHDFHVESTWKEKLCEHTLRVHPQGCIMAPFVEVHEASTLPPYASNFFLVSIYLF